MNGEPRSSDGSGEILNASAPCQVTYVFEDGHRRAVTLTVAEAALLRSSGSDRTTVLSRVAAAISWPSVAKWTAAAIAGALIANAISDRYSDRQSELALEGTLVKDVSSASVALFQQAQEARAVGQSPASGASASAPLVDANATDQRRQRDEAADAWVLASATLTPIFKVYYPSDSGVARNWDAYQAAMYNWAVLGCCTTPTGRQALVDSIHNYLDTYVGPATRPAPVDDPWTALAMTDAPDHDLYQWVGFYLLRGRGSLMNDLRHADANLD